MEKHNLDFQYYQEINDKNRLLILDQYFSLFFSHGTSHLQMEFILLLLNSIPSSINYLNSHNQVVYPIQFLNISRQMN